MMRRSGIFRMLMAFGLAAVLSFVAAPAAAQVDEDVYRQNTDVQKMFHKLGRGVSNVLLGWVEIPKNIAREWRNTEPFTGTIVGLIKGFGWGVARTIAGFYEVVSFPFPIPRNYDPIMYPEFILPSVWGERLPIYQDEFLASEANKSAAYSNMTEGATQGDAYTVRRNERSY